MGFTSEDFRKVVDKNHLTHRVDEDGDFVIGFTEDENDSRSIMVIYSIRDTQVHMRAYCHSFMDAGDASKGLRICNQWNVERILPKAYLDDDRTFVAEWSLLTDDETTHEYIEKFAIQVLPSAMSSFFAFVGEEMNSKSDENGLTLG